MSEIVGKRLPWNVRRKKRNEREQKEQDERISKIIDEWCLEWGLETSTEMELDLFNRIRKEKEE